MASAIVFGVLLEDARTDWPGRNQLMLALTQHAPVVLLERARPSRIRPHVDRLGENLYVMSDAFALRTHRVGRRLTRASAMLDGWWFRKALGDAGFTDYLMWLTVNDPVLALGVANPRLVYDCMDPNFLPHRQAEFDRDEFSLARRATVVFASARTLFERMSSVNPHTYLLPNAAPVRSDEADAEFSRPAGLAGRTGAVVGYLGTIDWRFDADHVKAAACAMPDVTFALVGRVNADQEEKVADLRALSNVVMPGQVDATEGDAYIGAFDVGIIPFTPSSMNDAINPVKMYMYLAAGLPVVSTWISECRENPFVEAARSPADFADRVKASLVDDSASVRRRVEYATNNTWTQRAAAAAQILSTHGLLR